MIKLGDAFILALTKLRMRKVRTVITVIIASLLFSGLAFASFVAGGVGSQPHKRYARRHITP